MEAGRNDFVTTLAVLFYLVSSIAIVSAVARLLGHF
jgi:hypothetical protein